MWTALLGAIATIVAALFTAWATGRVRPNDREEITPLRNRKKRQENVPVRKEEMKKHALLFRLNPKCFRNWESKIFPNTDQEYWWPTGRRRPEDIHPGIQVIVLGTNGLGVVAFGETSTEVVCRADPDWQDASPEKQEKFRRTENRVCARIRRVNVPLARLQENPLTADLHKKARESVTWLDENTFKTIWGLIRHYLAG
jgi:hypothetical protein